MKYFLDYVTKILYVIISPRKILILDSPLSPKLVNIQP